MSVQATTHARAHTHTQARTPLFFMTSQSFTHLMTLSPLSAALLTTDVKTTEPTFYTYSLNLSHTPFTEIIHIYLHFAHKNNLPWT